MIREREVRVLVADDSPLLRRALCDLVAATPGCELLAVARSGAEAIELSAALAPDLVLIDVRMDGMSGIDATRAIVSSRPGTCVVVISASLTADVQAAAAGSGAAAAVAKRDLTSGRLAELAQLVPE